MFCPTHRFVYILADTSIPQIFDFARTITYIYPLNYARANWYTMGIASNPCSIVYAISPYLFNKSIQAICNSLTIGPPLR